MRAFVVVEAEPGSELAIEVGLREVDGRPELLEVGALAALDLAIEVR
jgi:hypothetical protein